MMTKRKRKRKSSSNLKSLARHWKKYICPDCRDCLMTEKNIKSCIADAKSRFNQKEFEEFFL